jgi:NAD+ kinase
MVKQDFTVVFGGDGTLLKTARSVTKKSLPILSVHTGTLGFLTEIKPDKLSWALKKISKGQFLIEKRTMLTATIHRGKKKVLTIQALNEISVRNVYVRLIGLTVKIDGKKWDERIKADGVIVATPTGSTGYTHSAGGPIVKHTQKKIILTPICPFQLKQKPKVVSDESKISILVDTVKKMTFSADGQVMHDLEHGDVIKIKKSPHEFQLIRLKK